MYDFPYDRQKMSLDLLEFVWRSDKDSTDHAYSMNICAFTVETESLLPEWEAAPAIIKDKNKTPQMKQIDCDKQPPAYASRFSVILRVERRNWYYVVQVFGLTILITVSSCFPLCLPPSKDHVGDRLALYAGGLLTLTAFKYGVADQLPSVPYSTKFDRIMFYQMVTLVVLSLEALIAYRIVDEEGLEELDLHAVQLMTTRSCDIFEDVIFLILVFGWLLYWFYLAADQLGFSFGMKAKSWAKTMENQDKQTDFSYFEEAKYDSTTEFSIKETKLEKLNQEIFISSKNGVSPRKIQELQAQRLELESKLYQKDACG